MNHQPTTTRRRRPPADTPRAHAGHDHIGIVFKDRQHAEEALEELRQMGLGNEHLDLAVHHGDPVVFERDSDSETVHDTAVSAACGAPLGFLVAAGVVALAVSGIGAGGVLAVGAVGALWGAFLGSYVGLCRNYRISGEHERIEYSHHEEGEVLVVLCHHSPGDDARDALLRHEGQLRDFALPAA